MLKRNTKYSQKGLNNFTLSQLSFRINDYTKILSMVSIMFALALGAITVGLGFNNQIDNVVNGQNYYDVQVTNPNATQEKNIKQLSIQKKDTYNFKSDGKAVYYRNSQFKSQPIGYANMNVDTMVFKLKKSSDPAKNSNAAYELMNTRLPKYRTMEAKFVSDTEYAAVKGQESTTVLIRTTSFKNNLPMIKQISKDEIKRFPELKNAGGDKYSAYTLVNGFFSGLEFMGFFLGIAFLAMLASCLMFKILSGANGDVKRYSMLYKIGTRQKVLRSTINKEIGVLFSVPAILGIIHVLIGLQLFVKLLYKPYTNIEIPFAIFLVLYLGYYFLTRYLYKKIVLK